MQMQRLYFGKRSWDSESDQLLIEQISRIGPRQWHIIAKNVPGREGKQCRERWVNNLSPLLRETAWSCEEIWIIYIMRVRMNNTWAMITMGLLGRPDNSIKNFCNGTLGHKRASLEGKLNNYLSICRYKDVNFDEQEVVQRLLRFFIHVA